MAAKAQPKAAPKAAAKVKPGKNGFPGWTSCKSCKGRVARYGDRQVGENFYHKSCLPKGAKVGRKSATVKNLQAAKQAERAATLAAQA